MKLADYLSRNQIEEDAFAALLGVSEKAVSHWTAGRRTPRAAQMHSIILATAGAVKPNDFLPATWQPAQDPIGGPVE